MEIVIALHVIAGSWWLVAEIADRWRPQLAAVSTLLSGVGLAVNSGQIGRSCASLTAMVAVIYAAKAVRKKVTADL